MEGNTILYDDGGAMMVMVSRLGLRKLCVTKLLLLKLKLSFTNVELYLFFEAVFYLFLSSTIIFLLGSGPVPFSKFVSIPTVATFATSFIAPKIH